MAKTFQVEVINVDYSVFSGQAVMVSTKSQVGELGILPGHMPLLAGLQPGYVKIKLDSGEEELILVTGGFIEVQPEKVTILSDGAERGHNIDEIHVEAARKAAAEADSGATEVDYAKAHAELLEATSRLRMVKNLRTSKQK